MIQRDLSARALGLKIKFGLALGLLLLIVIDTAPLSRAWNDWTVRMMLGDEPVAGAVTIVDIDDRSLAAIGRWPWSRSELAAFFSLLALHEPRTLGVDLFFPETGDLADNDLIDSLAASDIVLAVAFDFESAQRAGNLPGLDAQIVPSESGPEAGSPRELGWVGLFPNLAKSISVEQIGHVNIKPGLDGVVRSIPGPVNADGAFVLSFPEQMVNSARGQGGAMDRNAEHIVPYVFDPRSIPTVSAVDVLDGSAPPELLRNRVLVVGSSAAGLADRVSTPLGFAIPGVLLQSMMIESWLAGHTWADASVKSSLIIWVAVAVGLLSLLMIGKMTSARYIVGYALIAMTVLIVNGFDRAINAQMWDPIPLVLVCSVVVGFLSYQVYAAQKIAADRVRNMFQSYVPNAVLDRLLTGDVARFDQGERLRVTVLFADLIGFTPYAEASTPTELTQTMRHVLNTLTEIILKHGGTVDKYMGDGVMAFWGAPLADPDQATHAVQCAIEMQAAILALPYGLRLGVGINTGEATVGNMGSDFRHAYSVLGDSVNVAARLEGQTRQMGHSILLGKTTADECAQPTCSLGEVAIKGKRACIEVFCLQSA